MKTSNSAIVPEAVLERFATGSDQMRNGRPTVNQTMELLPPSDTMYRALVNRDSTFEGIFFVAVRTTGIFCRPTCSAKTPARMTVEFFATPNEALHGGYRPCLRCRPMDSG